mgnify:CR=1 FL=1
MNQTKKGNEWRFEVKCHIDVDVGSGLVHTITVTAANVHDIPLQIAFVLKDVGNVTLDFGGATLKLLSK